jgi:thymidylate kinase
VEVFCDCPPRAAAERFHARARHAGHFDQDTSFADSLRRYERVASTLPLDLGPVVRVDTSRDVDVAAVAAAVRAAVDRARLTPGLEFDSSEQCWSRPDGGGL